jgi:16S rRNA (uracil1498-N3)-methyltransferase
MRDENKILSEPGGKLRLFVTDALGPAARITPSESQAHYLLHVMRARAGDGLGLFNGRDGEWRARIAEVGKRSCVLICEARVAEMRASPDLWLAFAPIKKTPSDYVAQKATELGVRLLQPVITHRTIARRVNVERIVSNAIEAAEQSERLDVPDVREPVALDTLLKNWPRERHLVFCDEGGAPPIASALGTTSHEGGWGILTGPEGGFDDTERALIRGHNFVLPVSLGPRIMRADTAALAALSVWGALKGDWHA